MSWNLKRLKAYSWSLTSKRFETFLTSLEKSQVWSTIFFGKLTEIRNFWKSSTGWSESADPTRSSIQWVQKSENVQTCLFMGDIAFGVHLAEKKLKIANVWSESADPTADSVATECPVDQKKECLLHSPHKKTKPWCVFLSRSVWLFIRSDQLHWDRSNSQIRFLKGDDKQKMWLKSFSTKSRLYPQWNIMCMGFQFYKKYMCLRQTPLPIAASGIDKSTYSTVQK